METFNPGQRPLLRLMATSGVSLAFALTMGSAAFAQASSPPEEEEIVVTGIRAALDSALALKKSETAAVDSILAEDIGKFPDSNLAESMQRVPGVALSRGDGGEGRNISVRGLGAAFTRVRINGMEGTAQTGSSDIYGAGNSGRSFDFSIFPSEIFSALSVRKTTSADVEEGSLGATVDLSAPKPLDLKQDSVFTASIKNVYNEVSESNDPKFSGLVAHKFLDGKLGVLASLAYQQRNIREVGYSAVDILSANSNGLNVGGVVYPFCTPLGFSATSPSPVAQASKGATADNCSTNNPRTSSLAAFNTVMNLRRADLPNTPGSGAFLPRIPRYLNSTQENTRVGGSLSVQYKPSEDTEFSADLLFSRYDVERHDDYIAGLSLARSVTNNGQPMVSVRDIQFDANGSLVYGVFDGMDIRSESLVDHFVSDFKQVNLNFRHRFNEKFTLTSYLGINESIWDGKKRFQTFMDIIDADGFTIDFRDGGTTPKITYGVDVSNPANFQYAVNPSDGTVLGGYSFQGKPSENRTLNTTFELNGTYEASDAWTLKGGVQFRESDYTAINLSPFSADLSNRKTLPTGVTLASLTSQITGVNEMWGNGAPASWAVLDADKWNEAFNLGSVRYCGVECGGGYGRVREAVSSAYALAAFDTDGFMGMPLRGDVGVRFVHTSQFSAGSVPVADSTTPTGSRGVIGTVKRDYDDLLPSGNLVIEVNPDYLIRLSAAKVMSRPELGVLQPTSGITATTRTGNINNPYLDPIRATTFDAAFEWYFRKGSVISAAFFYKDIETFVQRVTSVVPFSSLGLPEALLAGTNTAPTENFTIGRFENTKGGPLKGLEINAQVPFDFLPGLWGNFGALGNFTTVESEIQYILASANGVPTVTTTKDLIGLSKYTASGTVYYEDDKFSARVTGSYRDKFIRGIPASPGSDLQGNSDTFYVDFAASYNLNDNFKLSLEAQNLTDEQNRLFIDSKREDTLFETRIGRTLTLGVTMRY